jgi:hypothetical protein
MTAFRMRYEKVLSRCLGRSHEEAVEKRHRILPRGGRFSNLTLRIMTVPLRQRVALQRHRWVRRTTFGTFGSRLTTTFGTFGTFGSRLRTTFGTFGSRLRTLAALPVGKGREQGDDLRPRFIPTFLPLPAIDNPRNAASLPTPQPACTDDFGLHFQQALPLFGRGVCRCRVAPGRAAAHQGTKNSIPL